MIETLKQAKDKSQEEPRFHWTHNTAQVLEEEELPRTRPSNALDEEVSFQLFYGTSFRKHCLLKSKVIHRKRVAPTVMDCRELQQ